MNFRGKLASIVYSEHFTLYCAMRKSAERPALINVHHERTMLYATLSHIDNALREAAISIMTASNSNYL